MTNPDIHFKRMTAQTVTPICQLSETLTAAQRKKEIIMSTLAEAAQAFLAQRRIAVAGVSRKGDTAANIIYKKLRETG